MIARLIVVLALLAGPGLGAEAPQSGGGTVRVVAPATVVFPVTDAGSTTAAGSVTVSFDLALLGPGQALRVSVKSDGDLTMAGGPAISSTDISWTTASVVSGIGINGTMSKTVYNPVFQSQVGASSGRVDVTFTLASPGTSLRAGTRQAALRWRFEAITP